MNSISYRKLGSSGLRVSVPILGAMSFGTPDYMPWVLDEERSLEVLKAAWDRGINTIDTANAYSNGESERIIGKFIKKYNIPRSQIIIATKCHHLVPNSITISGLNRPQPNTREYVNHAGLSRAAIFNAVDASLERLGTSYIDLLQIHRIDPDAPAEETMKALHDLVQSGKVRYIGASSMRCWQFAHFNEVASRNGWTKFVSMQNEYSLLYREEEREMLPYCQFNGIGVIPYGPLAGGLLCRPVGAETTARAESFKGTSYERKITEADKEVLSRVEELAKKKGTTMGRVALAWVQSKISSPIVGTSSVARLDENIVDKLSLNEEEMKYLESPYVPKPVRGHP